MGEKTLGECVNNDSFRGRVFRSSTVISSGGQTDYVVVGVDGKNYWMSVIPVSVEKGRVASENFRVGLYGCMHYQDEMIAGVNLLEDSGSC